MSWLNYHHLHYFWVVAREGGLSHAAKKLRVSHSSIRAQIDQLEDMLGHRLFEREGRRLRLTEVGHLSLRYADQIFGLGQEYLGVVRAQAHPVELRLRLGLAHVVPKHLVHTVLSPILDAFPEAAVSFTEGQPAELLKHLLTHELDALVVDSRVTSPSVIPIHHHALIESTVSFLCPESIYNNLKEVPFPEVLENSNLLLPSYASAMRRSIETWLSEMNLFPPMRYEFDDSALMKVFGEAGRGIFPVPTVISEQIAKQFASRILGQSTTKVSFYAVSLQRQLAHPMLQKLIRDNQAQNTKKSG